MAFDGTLLWDYRNTAILTHHDVKPLPNGNVLLIAWQQKTAVEAVAAGRNPELLDPTRTFLPDSIVEFQPTGPTTGVIAWEWHIWDHLIQDYDPAQANFGVVADHAELVDINYPARIEQQFNHANGIDYDPIHDWIVLSTPKQNEIWIIDHSTTTAEAAGHSGGRWGKGGDLLYRWGDPAAYRAGPGSARMLQGQHAPRFIPSGYPGAGNVTVFNNTTAPERSAVVEVVLPLDASGRFLLTPGTAYGPSLPVWTYSAPGFYSPIQSSAERLPNGNTLICSATQDWLFEVTPEGQTVWEHHGGAGAVFHAHHTQRSLWADNSTVSAANGGRVNFNLLMGTTAANNTYLVLGSASGTTPGTPIGGVTLPLNVDPFLLASLTYPNAAPILIQTLGTMGTLGNAVAAFTMPPGAPIGLRLDFAYALFHQTPLTIKAASNTIPVTVLD